MKITSEELASILDLAERTGLFKLPMAGGCEVEKFVDVEGKVTVVVLKGRSSDETFGMGIARRNPIDKPLPQHGFRLAFRRACSDAKRRVKSLQKAQI